ncbi:MAG: tripartite tricarboxylate transporter TctB family protein [Christensenellales bacterium]|jgi:putative tricarboxylic transport membrane protein
MTNQNNNPIRKWNAGAIVGVLFTSCSVYYFVKSFEYPYRNRFGVGPGLFPRWVSLLAIVAGVVYTLVSIFKDKFTVGDTFPHGKELLNVLTTILAILVFVLIVKQTGFLVASVLLLFVLFIRPYPVWKALLYAIIVSAIVFAIFKIGFSVPIPVNRWGF